MVASVKFIVGNTYERTARKRAKVTRSGQRRIHDVTLFLDICCGDPDTIDRVVFELAPGCVPSEVICAVPVPAISPATGKSVWRFSMRQQMYEDFTARVKLVGMGGTCKTVTHEILLDEDAESKAYRQSYSILNENCAFRPRRMLKLPIKAKFGIELELTSPMTMSTDMIASHANSRRGVAVDVIDNYREGKKTSQKWKMVHDGSISCSVNIPNCNKFELVSPILAGGPGLRDVSDVLKSLNSLPTSLKVNKSMGFHVHIDVSSFNTSQLIKICQQFIKYEEVFDLIMPPSRRSGSEESTKYFKSNRQSVAERLGGTATNMQCHDLLGQCIKGNNTASLVSLMNREGRYYKLNMTNLTSGRQTTIEFRQHSATVNYDKVSAWVRFCMLFCYNSAKLPKPAPFTDGRGVNIHKKFEELFMYVVKDRALRDFYRERRTTLTGEVHDAKQQNCACCDECRGNGH